MNNDKSDKEKDVHSLMASTLPDLKSNELSKDFLKIRDNLRVIGDYSAGLSFAIPSKEMLGNYTSVLESQKMALASFSQISKEINAENGRLVSLMSDAMAPITNVVADIGLASVNATKLFGLGSINAKQLELTQGISGIALDTIQGYQDTLNESLRFVKNSGVFKMNADIGSSLKVASSGISEMMRSLPVFPIGTELSLPALKDTREVLEISKEEISDHQQELDKLLYKIDPSLVEFRKAVWETFNAKGRDYVGQSSSSMRRLVDSLLRALAPREKVTKTNFFEASPKAKDGNGHPTRKAKVLYVVEWDKTKAEHLMRITDGFLEVYDNLSAWDHTPIKKHSFVHGTLIAIEGYLISILTANKRD